jgi:hypothetical protein
MSGCVGILEGIIDEAYQNIEADHFELVEDDRIEILVGSEELPDFKAYINRVTPEGVIKDKSTFDVIVDDLDVNTVGEYEITYTFFSFDTSFEYIMTVYVVEEYTESDAE